MINRHIIPHIGERPLQKVTARELDELYDQLGQTKKYRQSSGRQEENGYSENIDNTTQYLSKTTVHEIQQKKE